MLGARAHDIVNRRLLESVAADGGAGHLSADQNDGDRIGHTIADRRDTVRGTRTRSNEEHAHLAGSAGVAGGHESSTLLVGRNDQPESFLAAGLFQMGFIVAEHGVIRRENSASRISEDRIYPLIRQDLNNHLSPLHGLTGQRMRLTDFFDLLLFHCYPLLNDMRVLPAIRNISGVCFFRCQRGNISGRAKKPSRKKKQTEAIESASACYAIIDAGSTNLLKQLPIPRRSG